MKAGSLFQYFTTLTEKTNPWSNIVIISCEQLKSKIFQDEMTWPQRTNFLYKSTLSPAYTYALNRKAVLKVSITV